MTSIKYIVSIFMLFLGYCMIPLIIVQPFIVFREYNILKDSKVDAIIIESVESTSDIEPNNPDNIYIKGTIFSNKETGIVSIYSFNRISFFHSLNEYTLYKVSALKKGDKIAIWHNPKRKVCRLKLEDENKWVQLQRYIYNSLTISIIMSLYFIFSLNFYKKQKKKWHKTEQF